MLVGTILGVLVAAVAAQSGDSPAGLRVLWKVPLGSSSFGGAAVADVTGDGIPDVAFCTYFGDSKVRVLRGKDGKEFWSYDAAIHPGKGDSCLDASCRFADLLGDGNLELARWMCSSWSGKG
jgi:hypothetical protein